MRDEDADIDTAAGPTTAGDGVCDVNDGLLLKAAHSRRIARPSPTTFLSVDAGNVRYSLTLNSVPSSR